MNTKAANIKQFDVSSLVDILYIVIILQKQNKTNRMLFLQIAGIFIDFKPVALLCHILAVGLYPN